MYGMTVGLGRGGGIVRRIAVAAVTRHGTATPGGRGIGRNGPGSHRRAVGMAVNSGAVAVAITRFRCTVVRAAVFGQEADIDVVIYMQVRQGVGPEVALRAGFVRKTGAEVAITAPSHIPSGKAITHMFVVAARNHLAAAAVIAVVVTGTAFTGG